MSEARMHSEAQRIAIAQFYQARYMTAPDDQWRYFRNCMLLHKAGVRVSGKSFEILKAVAEQLPNSVAISKFLIDI